MATGTALGISIYLARLSLTANATALGCDPGGGCDDVLASAWSSWLGIPVALIAATLYGSMFAAAWFIGARLGPRVRSAAWHILILGATAALGAAGWFAYVQFTVLKSICPYCLTTHAAGFIAAVLVLVSAPIYLRRGHPDGPLITFKRLVLLVGLGFLSTAALIVVQPHAQPPIEAPAAPAPLVPPVQPPPTPPPPMVNTPPVQQQPVPDRVITILEGRVKLRISENLLIGNPEAPHIVVFLFDYTCPHCRRAHGQLQQAMNRYRDQLAILALPFPLDADCNRLVPQTRPRHASACELTQTVWGTWNVDPKAFTKLDHWIASQPTLPSSLAAQQQAQRLLQARGHTGPLMSTPMNLLIQRSVNVYITAGRGPIPKMIFGKAVINGPATSPEQLFRLLEEQLDLTPQAGG